MYRYHVRHFLTVLFAFSATSLFAQTSTISNPLSARINLPYSRFGIGNIWNGNNTILKGMGNVTSAYEDPYSVNADNPASLSFLKLTTYEAGGQGEMHTLSSNDANYSSGTATLSYMDIGIPVGKNVGVCLGLRPYSNVYYNLVDTLASGNDTLIGNSIIHNYNGKGSINNIYIGAAGKYKGFSIGFTFGYMFGDIDNISRLINLDTTHAYNSTFIQSTRIGGIYWKGGAMYEGKLNKKYTLRLGGTISLQQNLNAYRNEYWVGSYSLVDTFIADTTYNAQQIKGTVVLPMSYSFGVHLVKNDQWDLGLDYTSTQWNQFRNMGDKDSVAAQAYNISLGGAITPNADALQNYWSRVTYRLGVYYGTNYVQLRGTQLDNYGVTVGASFPFRQTTDRIHMALDVGKVGTTSKTLLSDTYVRFSLGVSLNDKWFIKRKYD